MVIRALLLKSPYSTSSNNKKLQQEFSNQFLISVLGIKCLIMSPNNNIISSKSSNTHYYIHNIIHNNKSLSNKSLINKSLHNKSPNHMSPNNMIPNNKKLHNS